MLQLEDARVCSIEEVVTRFVLDIELVYAKLCVSVTLALEDVFFCVQKQVGIEKCQSSLNTLLFLLRKHREALEKLPHTIFQTLLNEGAPELSSEALNLLETKYSKMAYMEYLHKKDLQGRVQAKFQCSYIVTCFDVSPRLDYMVCECEGGTIQLWSLQTGKQLWKRDVKVTKYYYFEYDGYVFPIVPKSLYRSVVFHPTVDLVLPGILSHAYTFDGNLTPLFPSSKCRFCICSISADKTKMLTDCPCDHKSIIMWSLTDGSEINRLAWRHDIKSFAWSRDGRLLATSGLSGSIGLFDAMDGFRTLAQTSISYVREVMMIKFSPDGRCLYCLDVDQNVAYGFFRLEVNMENNGDCSLHIFPEQVSYCPWEFESCSETGYLLGDSFFFQFEIDTGYSKKFGLAFVLNKQSVLTVGPGSSIMQMLQLDELTKDSAGVAKTTAVEKAVFSLNGDILFVVTETDYSPKTLMGWDILTGMFKPGKVTGLLLNLVAVKEGVLLQGNRYTLELWNFELSECIRSWTDIENVSKVIPISEERVACGGLSKVIIVDTTREGIVSTIPIHGDFVSCNSKCHVITTHNEGLQMQCGDKVLWKMSLEFIFPRFCHPLVSFSPCEQYFVFAGTFLIDDDALFFLDAASGKQLRRFPLYPNFYWLPTFLDFKFVSDEECVSWFLHLDKGYRLQLFNVKSGDLLSEIALEDTVCSLAACPRERLIAIGYKDSKVDFKILRVKLPEDKQRRKSERIKLQE